MSDINVGDSGIFLEFGSTTIDLTGATCTLTITDPQGNSKSVPLVIGTTTNIQDGVTYLPNFWCYRHLDGTEFVLAGTHQLQPVLNLSSGVVKYIDRIYLTVGVKLGA